MLILHTADWHLGRHFEGRSLECDHAAILEQVLGAIASRKPDVLVISGDIFDRGTPPESAVRQFNGFIETVMRETATAVVLIAGNHDSAERIGAMATLADGRRALVRGPLRPEERPLVLNDAHGPVAISALPFAYEFAARDCFGDESITTPADVLKAQVEAARRHIPAGARWVVAAHAFVSGGVSGDCERPLSRVVGGIETVPAEVFEGAHYVALGHLHRPQSVGSERIRYAGAPLAFGFDEEGQQKSMALVELGRTGEIGVELQPFEPIRRVRTIKGAMTELLALAASDDLVRVVLTDPARLIDPMKRLRAVFPNACTLSYERDSVSVQKATAGASAQRLERPAALIGEFLDFALARPAAEAESRVVADELARLSGPEDIAA